MKRSSWKIVLYTMSILYVAVLDLHLTEVFHFGLLTPLIVLLSYLAKAVHFLLLDLVLIIASVAVWKKANRSKSYPIGALFVFFIALNIANAREFSFYQDNYRHPEQDYLKSEVHHITASRDKNLPNYLAYTTYSPIKSLSYLIRGEKEMFHDMLQYDILIQIKFFFY